MLELFHESIRVVNLPYTILFGLSAFYWVLYLVGVLGADLLDFDVDFDTDVDGNVDLDVDGGLDGGGSVLGAMMRFVHAAEVPVTVVASVLSVSMWAFSILTNHYLSNTSLLMALALAVPIVIGGVLATKIVLMPFVPLLKRAFDESSDVIHVIGQLCVVCSLEVSEKHGQAEVPLKGAPLLLSVKTRDGVVLKKGDEAVVFAKEDDGTYIIAPFEGGANKGNELEV
ncbi:MAG: hypothetical protein L3K26_03635 [Candidatus Hydrogenedentes bacterium]|nr:hypothetical protein [Candidatus Hydrogenedentota bacterium]